MRKITKNEDFIDVLSGEISLIKSVKYYTHLDPDNKITPILTTEDLAVTARIPSSQLANLKSGQLCCEIELQSIDEAFDDGTYDTIINDSLEVWLA